MISVAKKKASRRKAGTRKRSTSRKASQRKSSKKSSIWPFIVGIVILVIAIVGIVVLMGAKSTPSGKGGAEETVLVTVNGEPITESEFLMRKSLAPAALREGVDKQLLDILIAEELLMQQATEEGLVASDADVDQAIASLLEQGGLSEDDLSENLKTFGMSEESFREMIRQQLSIIRLLNETLTDKTAVSDEEVAAYYDEHVDEFFSEGTVTVRHILISGDDEKAKELAEDVLKQFQEGSDFCDLVEQYSADEGSREKCGQYTFPKGVMVPAFEEAAFAMEPGETRIVQTQYGYHVLLKIDEAEGRQLTLDETAPAIKQQLEREKQLAAYEEFIDKLRSSADIVYTDAGNEMVATPEPPTAPAPEGEDFASCVGKAAVLYTASWDSASQEQLAQFGDDVTKLTVVECTANKERCDAEGIEAYPTWVIGEQHHLGKLSPEMLSKLTGCQQ
ncbi:hypothetical protein D6789_02720 [Candidatus Woesearchaeota archaeon]|nr:MAG: hypothetical protein D6789_02720 [Candidatus Woesearchaeota archaeon]